MVDYEVFIARCPHCGAPVTEITCPYCNSLLVDLPEVEEKPLNSVQTGYIVRQSHRMGVFDAYDPVLKGVNRCADDILAVYAKHSDAILATSTYNPFLLVGALLTVTSGSVVMIKSGTRAFAECKGGRLIISV